MKAFLLKNKIAILSGLIAIIICISLFGFYWLIYFPVVEPISHGNGVLILPALTGHLFVFLSHFMVEGSPLISMICPSTSTTCTRWEESAGCIEGILVPKTACAEGVELGATIYLMIALLTIYFVVGFAVGRFIQTKNN
jgi:hypothetical protein